MKVRVLAPAKINLSLDVIGRREDGYHLLRSVMQTVSLYDTVTVAYGADDRIRLQCDGGIPADEHNTAYQAAAIFREVTGCTDGFVITVNKVIPSQAGLAGGSSDAASVLKALNVLTNAGLSDEDLCRLGERIGADVPFCVRGGTVLCTGTGTELTPQTALPPCTVVIVKPSGGVSTPVAYRLIDEASAFLHPDVVGQCEALKKGDIQGVFARVGNSFEEPLELPHTADICHRLAAGGASAQALSGSGSAVFGLFTEEEVARRCAEDLRRIYPQTFVCYPCEGILLETVE